MAPPRSTFALRLVLSERYNWCMPVYNRPTAWVFAHYVTVQVLAVAAAYARPVCVQIVSSNWTSERQMIIAAAPSARLCPAFALFLVQAEHRAHNLVTVFSASSGAPVSVAQNAPRIDRPSDRPPTVEAPTARLSPRLR